MQILSHRGLWLDPSEKNQVRALARSFAQGWGTETDLRDGLGELLIAHDPPTGAEPRLADLLALERAPGLTLALNIKADGLAQPLREAMRAVDPRDWFVFDMSVPDMRAQLAAGNPVFARLSEVEPGPPWIDRLAGVWLDGFDGVWFDRDLIRGLLARGLRVCVVSAELHGRQPDGLWAVLAGLRDAPGLMLCTDRPGDARAFFGAGVT